MHALGSRFVPLASYLIVIRAFGWRTPLGCGQASGDAEIMVFRPEVAGLRRQVPPRKPG